MLSVPIPKETRRGGILKITFSEAAASQGTAYSLKTALHLFLFSTMLWKTEFGRPQKIFENTRMQCFKAL